MKLTLNIALLLGNLFLLLVLLSSFFFSCSLHLDSVLVLLLLLLQVVFIIFFVVVAFFLLFLKWFLFTLFHHLPSPLCLSTAFTIAFLLLHVFKRFSLSSLYCSSSILLLIILDGSEGCPACSTEETAWKTTQLTHILYFSRFFSGSVPYLTTTQKLITSRILRRLDAISNS